MVSNFPPGAIGVRVRLRIEENEVNADRDPGANFVVQIAEDHHGMVSK